LIIIGLDGKEYSWIPSNNIVDTEKRSELHNKAKYLLKEKYPNDRILEELVLPGTKTDNRKSVLKADFFIPVRSIIIEVHGQQHTEFNNFFFKNKMEFYKAQARDRDKKHWCELNNFELIELFHNESIEDWRHKIWKT
jgi:very-short-patch-repair endonuclease